MSERSYKMGTRLAFRDCTATVSDEVDGISTGTVNGPPLTDYEKRVTHVPVFAERDNGREPTTIYVAVEDIVGPKP